MIAQYEQRMNDAIEKLDDVKFNNRKTIKVDQIKEDMRLFGQRGEDESDEEEDAESSGFSEESKEEEAGSETSESSSSDEDENTIFIPSSLRSFQEVFGDNVIIKKNTYKFKKGFNLFAQ